MAHIWNLLMCSALVISVTAHPTSEMIIESTSPSNDRTTSFNPEPSTLAVTQNTQQDFPIESAEVSSEKDSGDMVVAETIVFRPLFRYRHDSAERRWGSSRHNYRNHWGSRPSYY